MGVLLNKENYSLSYWKGIACLLVVLLHCDLSGIPGLWINLLSRVAVPFFFMISGFYLEENGGAYAPDRLLIKIRKTAMLLMSSVILYAVFYFLVYLFDPSLQLGSFAAVYANKPVIALGVLANKISFGEHLWFISALLYVYLATWFAASLHLKCLGNLLKNPAFCTGLFLCGYFLRSFFLNGTFSIGPFLLSRRELYRNWLFMGIPFVGIGRAINAHVSFAETQSKAALMALIIFGIALSCVEYALSAFLLEVYIGTLFCVVGIFCLCCKYSDKGQGRLFCFIGKELSVSIYVLHPILISVLGYWDIHAFAKVFIAITGTILLSFGYWELQKMRSRT